MARRPEALAALAFAFAAATVALWFAANDLAGGRALDARLGNALHDARPTWAHELLQGASSLADVVPFAVGAGGALAALGAIAIAGTRLRPVTALLGLGHALGVGTALAVRR
ncbi:MAG: hypothetical protein ACRDMZ_14120 [Solirubrobacteraceae bacterium]